MKESKKSILVALAVFTVFSLSGCFNFFGDETGDQQPEDSTSSTYQTDEFSMNIPRDWEVIDQNDFTADVPPETVVVFRNNVKNETFTANVNVVRRGLQEPVSSLEYANLVSNRQKSGLIDYRELRKEEITLQLGGEPEKTYFTAFESRKATNERLIRYLQIYGVRGNSAFIVTGAVSPQENQATIQTVENIVRSFTLR